jgi:hypothetical protein
MKGANESVENVPVSSYGQRAARTDVVMNGIGEYLTGPLFRSISSTHRMADRRSQQTITNQLLSAVAFGMQSMKDNEPVKPIDVDALFKAHLYAEELLKLSPEFLLEKGDVRDWAGRKFSEVSAFQYVVWAGDVRMLKMMLSCIPDTEKGAQIKAGLVQQYTEDNGLIYTFLQPDLDAAGIPVGTTHEVTLGEKQRHFNVKPLLEAYENYICNHSGRTEDENNAYWTRWIGFLQRQLPVHLLQRYCAVSNWANVLPKRSMVFYHQRTQEETSLFSAADFGVDFALMRQRINVFLDSVQGSPSLNPKESRPGLTEVLDAHDRYSSRAIKTLMFELKCELRYKNARSQEVQESPNRP